MKEIKDQIFKKIIEMAAKNEGMCIPVCFHEVEMTNEIREAQKRICLMKSKEQNL